MSNEAGLKDLIGDYHGFVANINRQFDEFVTIDRKELAMLDHLCYRVETVERYHEMLHRFSESAQLLGETEINGRPIATFEFKEPLRTGGWRIPYLELPAPKDGSPYKEGLEHAEFVTIGDVGKFAEKHAGLPFDRAGMNKLINPELGLKLPAENLSVKFHEQPLGAVVRIENRLKSAQLIR
jgi:predicted metalloenzyme YecM